MATIDQLAERLAPHYSHFDVANRLLFTGHSHQAWPDVALEGLKDSFMAAASRVDNKWDKAFEKTEVLRDYLRTFYDDPEGYYCLGQNTHQLLVSWLSSLDIRNKPRIVTTSGEFHSLFRQLSRLSEEGLQVHMVDAESKHIVDDINHAVNNQTCAVMLSRVYFESGLINQYLPEIATLVRSKDIPLLIDDYHGTNVAPISLRENQLEDCFILIGGYKYLQWGEGNCFLRFPRGTELRPVITGWFSSFSTLDQPRSDQPVRYDDGDQRFASGTYDPASQFRAAKVVDYFRDQQLTPKVLRNQYQQQVALLRDLFLDCQIDPSLIRLKHERPLEENGGFLALQSPHARGIRALLLKEGVFTDARGDILRIGPAPYITSSQIERAIDTLKACVKKISNNL